MVTTPTSDANIAPEKSNDFFLYPINASRTPKNVLTDIRLSMIGSTVEEGSCANRMNHPAKVSTERSFKTLFNRTLFVTKFSFFSEAD